MYDKKVLMEDLKIGVTEIYFVGAPTRPFKCTLDPKHMPPSMKPEDLAAAAEDTRKNEHFVNVWDIDKNKWQVFNINAVQSAQFIPTYD